MDHPFTFRPETCDAWVFDAVVRRNEYRLPDAFGPDDIILDIGTHIGSFCYAAAVRGAGQVYGFEPFVENYRCAARNLAAFGERVKVHHRAVWRSDRRVDTLAFSTLELEPENTGAGTVLGRTGDPVQAVALDDILGLVTEDGRRRVRMMKVDCEGSEYPILLTSRHLHLVDRIVGEYHNYTPTHDPRHPFHHIPEHAKVRGYDRFTIDVLAGALRRGGFDVAVEKHPLLPDYAGWFFAERPARPGSRWRWDTLRRTVAGLRRYARPHAAVTSPAAPAR